MRGKTPVLAVVGTALALAAAACGGGSQSTQGSTQSLGAGGETTIAGQMASDHGTKDISGMTSVTLELDDFYFDPTVLKGTPGQKVELELENEGAVEHNFSITSQGIDRNVQPGQKATVEVRFPKSGTLSFVCKFHQSQGMVGGLDSTAGGSGTSGGNDTMTSSGY